MGAANVKPVKVAVIGMDGSGKTSIVHNIIATTKDHWTDSVEGKHFVAVNWHAQHLNASLYDVNVSVASTERDEKHAPGKAHNIWKHFHAHSDASILVVDSTNRAQIEEIAEELKLTLNHEHALEKKLLIFANKQDAPEGCMSVSDIASKLGLAALGMQEGVHWKVCAVSGKTGQGVHEAMEFLRPADRQKGTDGGKLWF